MLKKRVIFTLLVEDGYFVLSRNFKLQRAGDLSWLKEFYDFDSIAFSIDELVVLDVSRGERDRERFGNLLLDISKNCFMPIAAGGGVRSTADVELLLKCGADKIVVNTALFERPELISELVARYGTQCIVGSIDYKISEGGETEVYLDNGRLFAALGVAEAVRVAQKLGVGEIYLTSINRDGTGRGLDIESLKNIAPLIGCPLIASGGAGTYDHFVEALRAPYVSGVSTANLFNFMSDNLTEARSHVIHSGIPLASWSKLDQ
jgi:imidazole glycerol-phosphate synthase subunit HisF